MEVGKPEYINSLEPMEQHVTAFKMVTFFGHLMQKSLMEMLHIVNLPEDYLNLHRHILTGDNSPSRIDFSMEAQDKVEWLYASPAEVEAQITIIGGRRTQRGAVYATTTRGAYLEIEALKHQIEAINSQGNTIYELQVHAPTPIP